MRKMCTDVSHVYEMCTKTFGDASSPCAAIYIKKVKALEKKYDRRAPAYAVEAILDHHYVDDFDDSFCSEQEAISVSEQVRAIHMDARFELRNFTSNTPKVVGALNGTDTLRPIDKKECFELLTMVMSIFDPLGFLSNFVIDLCESCGNTTSIRTTRCQARLTLSWRSGVKTTRVCEISNTLFYFGNGVLQTRIRRLRSYCLSSIINCFG